MKQINQIISSNQYKLITIQETSKNVFETVYACDLLSAVIKHGSKSPLLITQIASVTTIGLCTMLDLPAVIITEGKMLDDFSIEKANEENLAVIYTHLTSAEVIIDLKDRNIL